MSASNRVPGFLPSTAGFHFANEFDGDPGYPVVTLPVVGTIISGDAGNGLCGGFVWSVLDLFEHSPRMAPPSRSASPPGGSALFEALASRLLDSFGSLPLYANVTKLIEWIQTPSHDTGLGDVTSIVGLPGKGLGSMMVSNEWPAIKSDIDDGRPSPIYLVREPQCGIADVPGIKVALGNAHQVLVWGYDLDDSQNLTLHVYDPNDPGNDGSVIQTNIAQPSHTLTLTAPDVQRNVGSALRAFFHATGYSAKAPGPANRWTPPGDYNGDGRTDFAVYDPSGQWRPAINNPGGNAGWVWGQWGGGPHDVPMVGDYNGDGLSDFCIYQADTGQWRPALNNPGGSEGWTWTTWGGGPHDIPIPGDFDGDGKADFCIYQADIGQWRPAINAANQGFTWTELGGPGWIPVAADFDGDGRTDPAVWNPYTGEWRIVGAGGTGSQVSVTWGNPRSIPLPGDFAGHGLADFCSYDPRSGVWAPLINQQNGASGNWVWGNWGGADVIPIPGDFNGDGRLDFCTYSPATGQWRPFINDPAGNNGYEWINWGGGTAMPVATGYHPLWRARFLDPAVLKWPIPIQATNLLMNAGFSQPSVGWRANNLASSVTLNWVSGYVEVRSSVADGSLAQDVPWIVRAGRCYVLTVWVRAWPTGPVKGQLNLWALGGAQQEVAGTPFSAGAQWSQVSVTLPVTNSDHATLRPELYVLAPGAIQVDTAELVDAGLAEASFESIGGQGWRANNLASAVSMSSVTAADAVDGGHVLQFSVSKKNGSVAQDTSARPVVGTTYLFEAWVRCASAQGTVSGSLAIWGLGATGETVSTAFTVGHAWTRVQTSLHIQNDGHSGLRAEIYLQTINSAVQVDATRLIAVGLGDASFELQTGSPWKLNNLASDVTITHETDPASAKDGSSWLRMLTTRTNGSIAQDLGRPLSGVTYTFSAWVRARPGDNAAVGGSLALWGLDGTPESSSTLFSVTTEWTLVTTTLDLQHNDHTGLRCEIYLISPNVNLDIDGARLTGANPAVLSTT